MIVAKVLEVVERLYDATTDVDKWPACLELVAHLFRARGAQVGHIDLVDRRLSFSVMHGYQLTPEHVRRYEALLGEDPRLPYFQSHPFQPVHCRMGISEATLHGSRVYREVLSQVGIEYSLGVNLVEDRRSTTFFLVLRERSEPPFIEADCELLGRLIPHVHRAVKLHGELGFLDFRNRVSLQALDQWPTALMVVDEAGRVQLANAAARALANSDAGLELQGDRFAFPRHDDMTRIMVAVRRAVAAARSGRAAPGKALAVARATAASPLSVVVSALCGAHLRLGRGPFDDGLAALFVTDPERPQPTSAELLQGLYGLTPAQARLTALLAHGCSLREAARELGITEGSARQYLKVVFERTGTRRQAELVAKVLASPLWANQPAGDGAGRNHARR